MDYRKSLRQIQQTENPEQFKNDKQCICCESPFSLMTKRYVCKFCNHGVCFKCSPLREFNNLLKSEARICIQCHNKAIENQITAVYDQDMQDYIKRFEDMAEELSEVAAQHKRKKDILDQNVKIAKQMEEKLGEEDNEQIERIQQAEDDNKRLIHQKQLIQVELSRAQQRLSQIRGEDDDTSVQKDFIIQQIIETKQKIAEVDKLLAEQCANNQQLQSNIQQQKELLKEREKYQNSKSVKEKKKQLKQLKAQNKILKAQHFNIKQQIHELHEESEAKDANLAVLSRQVSLTGSLANIEGLTEVSSQPLSQSFQEGTELQDTDYVRSLKFEIAEQFNTISLLYQQVSKSSRKQSYELKPIGIETLNLDEHKEKCIIQ